MQKNSWWAVGRTCFGVTDIQDTRIDLLQRSQRRIRSWLDRRDLCLPLCSRGTDHPELSSCDGHRGGAKEAASILVDFVRDLIHGQPPYWSMRGGSAERESKTLHARGQKTRSRTRTNE
jgi:hypothetical protein